MVRGGETGVGADSTIWKATPIIGRSMKSAGGCARRIDRNLLDRIGQGELRQCDLAGRGVAAFIVAEHFLRKRVHRAAVPPVREPAPQLVIPADTECALEFRIDFRECGLHGRDVAAMAVDEEEAAKAVASKRQDVVADDRDQRGRPDRHRAGEPHVMHGNADADRRADHDVAGVAHAAGDHFGADGVRADQAVGTVLFGRPDRQDDALGLAEIGFDFLPRLVLQQHRSDLLER